MTDDDLRELLTEFDELSIALSSDGLVARVAGVVVATGQTLADLLDGLTVSGATDTFVDTINDPFHRTPYRPRGYLVKAAPDLDLYGEWSSQADNVGQIGTRAQMAAYGFSEAQLARADRYGTSARWFTRIEGYSMPHRPDDFADKGLLVNNQEGPVDGGWLPRERLAEFLQATAAGDHVRAGALLDPLDD